MTTWINGREDTRVDAGDRGLQYGDGLFETMRVRRRRIRLLDHHLDRLVEGCRRLNIAAPDVARLRRELIRIALRRAEGVVKLIVTRGAGGRGYRPDGTERPTRIISLRPLPQRSAGPGRPPARLRLCDTRLSGAEALAGLKTLNRLDSVLARLEWADPRIWEGLMRDADDHIVCGTMSNLFIRRGTSLITPCVDRCGIAGVMRRWVMEEAGALGLQTREARIRWRDLARVDELFMTNAVAGVVPVRVLIHGRERIRLLRHRTARVLQRRLDLL
jgi:4-amino-4-deoxychorismate lyase